MSVVPSSTSVPPLFWKARPLPIAPLSSTSVPPPWMRTASAVASPPTVRTPPAETTPPLTRPPSVALPVAPLPCSATASAVPPCTSSEPPATTSPPLTSPAARSTPPLPTVMSSTLPPALTCSVAPFDIQLPTIFPPLSTIPLAPEPFRITASAVPPLTTTAPDASTVTPLARPELSVRRVPPANTNVASAVPPGPASTTAPGIRGRGADHAAAHRLQRRAAGDHETRNHLVAGDFDHRPGRERHLPDRPAIRDDRAGRLDGGHADDAGRRGFERAATRDGHGRDRSGVHFDQPAGQRGRQGHRAAADDQGGGGEHCDIGDLVDARHGDGSAGDPEGVDQSRIGRAGRGACRTAAAYR